MKENEFTHKPLLTKREKEVFELLVQDKTTKEIAGELFISEKTVRNHISNAMSSVCKVKKRGPLKGFPYDISMLDSSESPYIYLYDCGATKLSNISFGLMGLEYCTNSLI